MRRGQHAADDGSFGRSAGGAMARGIALIVAAVVLGVVLLNATDSPDYFDTVAAEDDGDDGEELTTDTADAELPDTTDTTLQPARDPSEVTVLVANGAGINGLASRVSDTLKAANYIVAEPGNTKSPAETSAIYYTPGFEADAHAVAKLLNPVPKVEPLPDPAPVDDLKGANVVVVAAADLAQATG